ncbi:anti-sigma factor domain-containing protein [Clostridium oryzae]|uniref:RsgI N-terminal anti-sigma domain-containing protein n=1 Tax=Clostridium oryzae TaxID=1450648 RepID=A0A1V4IRM1_9CLOT|nr:anti-sigma factor domain-containing protein [Clostridium oryzae]OPJ62117.1 hypothetical protein CLORY_19400 [Clostridium oryzae]
MMAKTGLVLKIENNTAIIITPSGEFAKVAISGKPPKIGDTYTGNLKRKHSYIRYLSAAVVLFMIFIFGGGTYGYCSTAQIVKVSINPSVELKVNYFGKIIKYAPLNNDGRILLKNLKLNNKTTDDALVALVKKAEKDNFINKDYTLKGKTISVEISSTSFYKSAKLDKFNSYVSDEKINTIIDNNGTHSSKKFNKNNNANSEKITKPTKKSADAVRKKHTAKKDSSVSANENAPAIKTASGASKERKQHRQTSRTIAKHNGISSKNSTSSKNTNKANNKSNTQNSAKTSDKSKVNSNNKAKSNLSSKSTTKTTSSSNGNKNTKTASGKSVDAKNNSSNKSDNKNNSKDNKSNSQDHGNDNKDNSNNDNSKNDNKDHGKK